MRGSQAQHVVSQVQDDDQATFALLPVVVAWGMAATCTSSFSSSTAAAVFNGMLVSFSTFVVSDAHMSLYLPDCLLRHLPRHQNTSTPLMKTRSGKNRSGRYRDMACGQVRIVGSSIKLRFPGRGIRSPRRTGLHAAALHATETLEHIAPRRAFNALTWLFLRHCASHRHTWYLPS